MGGVRGGCDLQTQWSERFRLETMRTCPAAFEMGIAQHTTRGEDRPLLSPIASRVEKGFWKKGLEERVGGRDDDLSLCWWWFRKKSVEVIRKQKGEQG